MTNVIEIKRLVEVEFVHALDKNSELITEPFAYELATHGANAWGETFEEYCERMEYHEARHPPRFPVPAPILNAEFHPWFEPNGFHSCVIIDDFNRGMVAIWDFSFDRCCDFNYDCGVYVNERQIREGTDLYKALVRLANER